MGSGISSWNIAESSVEYYRGIYKRYLDIFQKLSMKKLFKKLLDKDIYDYLENSLQEFLKPPVKIVHRNPVISLFFQRYFWKKNLGGCLKESLFFATSLTCFRNYLWRDIYFFSPLSTKESEYPTFFPNAVYPNKFPKWFFPRQWCVVQKVFIDRVLNLKEQFKRRRYLFFLAYTQDVKHSEDYHSNKKNQILKHMRVWPLWEAKTLQKNGLFNCWTLSYRCWNWA